jgi:hypothetical protein
MSEFESEGEKRIKQLEKEYIHKEVKITRGKFKGREGYISNLCATYPFTPPFVNAHVEIYYKKDKSKVILDYAYSQHWHTLDTLELKTKEHHKQR